MAEIKRNMPSEQDAAGPIRVQDQDKLTRKSWDEIACQDPKVGRVRPAGELRARGDEGG